MTTDSAHDVFAERTLIEERWAAREGLLNAHGYRLRPRLQKDWSPSWLTTGKSPLHSEDGELLPTHLVDASTEDGKLVYIKELNRGGEEGRIAQMLSTEESRKDPRNHSVPIIEIFDDPEDDTKSYMVMPLLRAADSPAFEFVKEIVDFIDQILEGLVFLHEKGVAHRDCVMHNLMMDADAMYPEGFHPVRTRFKRDYSGYTKPYSRSSVGVKYYFVDFGISVHIPEDVANKVVTGHLGRDQVPPELSTTVPYDPFRLDVFIIGNMFKQELCKAFSNVDFILPLVQRMTALDPEQRPTAGDALREWREIRGTISTIKNEWRPRPRDEDPLSQVVLDVISLYKFFMYFARSCISRVGI